MTGFHALGRTLAAALLIVWLTSAAALAGTLRVTVGIPPHAYLAQSIGGDRVTVHLLVQAGRSHETFEPTPRQLSEWGRSRVFFTSGLPFEAAWVPRLKKNYPHIRIVDTADGIALAPIEPGSAGKTGGAAGLDPHVWLAPANAKVQARTMARVLSELDPAHRREYAQGLTRLERDLDQLDRDLRERLSGPGGKTFVVYHPAWGYFARAYGWTQLAVEREGKDPGPRSLQALIARARQAGAKRVFVQTGEDPQRARVVARALGGDVVEIDALPLDYPGELRRMAAALAEVRP